jgi:hypothetical protein
MKITRRQLRQLIKEEASAIFEEANTTLYNINLSKLPKLKRTFQSLVSTAESGQSVGKFVASAKWGAGGEGGMPVHITVDAGQTTTSKEHTARLKKLFQHQMVLAYHKDAEVDKEKEYSIQLVG